MTPHLRLIRNQEKTGGKCGVQEGKEGAVVIMYQWAAFHLYAHSFFPLPGSVWVALNCHW